MTRKINFLVILCSFVFFLHTPAFGQTLSKTISLSGLFTSTDFKGAPTVSKTKDGFTIILEKATWDVNRNAVKISSGGSHHHQQSAEDGHTERVSLQQDRL